MKIEPYIWRAFWIRFFVLLVAALVLTLGISELFYALQRTDTERSAEVIEITIPAGTAQQIADGGPGPELPAMIFVVGDTLMVHNQDEVAHQLGPVWVPAGASGSLTLDSANNFSYSCSFQSSRYLGLTVRQATDWSSRLAALWYGAPPLFMFLLVYSFVLVPVRKPPRPDQASREGI
ncbi:MAG: hypothetical protein JW862_00635 [Anaerolineales bacterium]|nr:hypothetical protein [Anaerolineales bacterium]